MATANKYKIDMCHGPLLKKIIQFAIPLMMANVMALMFHAADLIVVGRFASAKAMVVSGGDRRNAEHILVTVNSADHCGEEEQKSCVL